MSAALARTAARVSAALKARRTTWLALGAIAFGALAMLGARNYIGDRLAQERAQLADTEPRIEVVVARRELRRGDTIDVDTMAVRSFPRDVVPGGAVLPARFDAVVGSRVAAPMRAGEPLLAAQVVAAAAAPISSRVRPGVRAMTIAVDEVNSLSGMLQPGDRIDLLLSVRPLGATGVAQGELTRTVMQGVTVMATGRQARASGVDDAGPGRPYTSITVEVDPLQAQRLVVAQRSGKLTAVLRNPDDRTEVADRSLDVNALLGLPPPSPPPMPVATPAPAPAPVLARVEVIVGGRGSAAPVQPGALPQAAGTPSGSAGSPVPAPASPTPPAQAAPVAQPAESGLPAVDALRRALEAQPTPPSAPPVVPLYR